MKTLDVLNDFVCVELDPRKAEIGGIILAEKHQPVPVWGAVKAVGPKVEDLFVGDRVYVRESAGTHLVRDGRDFVILREGQVLAKGE